MIGYKYISEAFSYKNYMQYLSKSEGHEPLSYDEFECNKGVFDSEDNVGIYFCASQNDLIPWIEEVFDEYDNICGIDILEVNTVGNIKTRQYEDGRVAYITDKAYVRLLDVTETSNEINQMCDDYFKE